MNTAVCNVTRSSGQKRYAAPQHTAAVDRRAMRAKFADYDAYRKEPDAPSAQLPSGAVPDLIVIRPLMRRNAPDAAIVRSMLR